MNTVVCCGAFSDNSSDKLGASRLITCFYCSSPWFSYLYTEIQITFSLVTDYSSLEIMLREAVVCCFMWG